MGEQGQIAEELNVQSREVQDLVDRASAGEFGRAEKWAWFVEPLSDNSLRALLLVCEKEYNKRRTY